MDRKLKKIIEDAFFNYKKISSEAVISTVEWAESNLAIDYSKVSVKSSSTGGKEEKLCEIIDNSQNALRWCYVVEKTLDFFKWDIKEKLIRIHFFERKSVLRTCQEIHCSRRTCLYWKDEILTKAYQWAIELKLLKE